MTYTDALYAEPSLIEGVGRLMDLAALMRDYNYSLTPRAGRRAGRPALADRGAVRSDVAAALRQLANEIEHNAD